ncbi:MAG: Vgb family protein [Thermoanaerobaculia bacterium]
MRVFLSLLLTLPLFAQLPAGTSRLTFRDDITDATYFAATGDVLWVGSLLDDTIERIELDGAGTRLDLPPQWGLTASVATGPDGALWLCSSRWIARVDPASNEMERWPIGNGTNARSILSGPDGNIWFLQGDYVLRMRSDGTFLSFYPTARNPTVAAFGSDGALYLTFPEKLMRITAAGERTEFPGSPRGLLFAGTDFLWNADPRSGDEAVQTPVGEIVKMSYRGETLATYRIDMSPIASDPLGNLWLRAKTDEGDIVGQLTPSGVLTRFGPLPSPVATDCHPRHFGGLAFLSDGRVAMTDFYWLGPRPMVGPCAGVPRPDAAKNTITILDPRLAPVLSIEVLERSNRRRSARH